MEDGESSDAPNPTCTGTDVDRSGEGDAPLNRDCGKARRTPTPVGVSQSPAAGVADVVTRRARRIVDGSNEQCPTGRDVRGNPARYALTT